MDILDENTEIEPEEIEEKPAETDPDKLLEDEIKQHLDKKGGKLAHHKCSRCKKDLGSVDQWFNYGVKVVKFGYTMMPKPLCKDCFKDFENFMNAFEVKK